MGTWTTDRHTWCSTSWRHHGSCLSYLWSGNHARMHLLTHGHTWLAASRNTLVRGMPRPHGMTTMRHTRVPWHSSWMRKGLCHTSHHDCCRISTARWSAEGQPVALNAHARYLLDSALRRGKARALRVNNCLVILDSPISLPHALPQPSSSRRSGYSRRSRQRCTTLTSSSSVSKHTLGGTRRFQLAHDAQVEGPLKAHDNWRTGVSWAN